MTAMTAPGAPRTRRAADARRPLAAGARRAGVERGVVSIELIGYFIVVMVVALGVIQLFVAGYVAVSATNAARTGARVASLGGGGEAAAMAALAPGLQGAATVAVGDGLAVVQVDIPVLMMGGTSVGTITRSADMPVAAGPAATGEHSLAAGPGPHAPGQGRGAS